MIERREQRYETITLLSESRDWKYNSLVAEMNLPQDEKSRGKSRVNVKHPTRNRLHLSYDKRRLLLITLITPTNGCNNRSISRLFERAPSSK